MKNILFIGGLGYIGSSLVAFFRDKGYTCTVMDLGWFGKFISDDIPCLVRDFETLTREELDEYDIIVLTAAHSSVKMCTNAPLYSMKNNVFKHINLVKKLTHQKFIYMSSSSVYGNTKDLQVDETYPVTTPNNEYDLEKWIIDEYMVNTDLDYYGLRLGTVNGYSPNLRTDIMINSMVTNALNDQEIKLYITDIWRPIIGITDLSRVIKKIIKTDTRHPGIYNISSFNSTVKDIGENISKLLNVPCKLYNQKEIEDQTNVKLQTVCYNFSMSCKKFETIFDFKFQSNIESIVKHLIDNYNKCNKSSRNITIDKVQPIDCIEKKECRVCKNKNIECILDLGHQPLANSYHDNTNLLQTYPLKLMLCDQCWHTQLSHVVDPTIMFKNYQYFSGTSKTLDQYFQWLASKIDTEFIAKDIDKNILEIACNDGSQLNHFSNLGWETFGVDPAENIHKTSSKSHNIYCDYFGTEFADKLKHKKFSVILAENVFAHVDNIDDFLQGCKKLMNETSLLFIQTSQCDMFNNNEFDTIYHEHLSFFSINSMNVVAKNNGMYIKDFEKTPIHGTSYLFTLAIGDDYSFSNDLIKSEKHLYTLERYKFYIKNVETTVSNLKKCIIDFKSGGYKIVGYGAAAKGNTLLNYTKINLDYIVDDCLSKVGLYTPGMNIIIKEPEYILNDIDKKVVILPLAWNFFNEIYSKTKNLLLKYDEVSLHPNIKFVKYFPDIQIVSMNRTTVISHFYNEEYLLPFWLKHHASIFDHGIMIDYDSTDNSVKIIKEICPTWTIINSKNKYFDAIECDKEVVDIEKTIAGWKIALNITEFLLGDIKGLLNKGNIIKIKPLLMCDPLHQLPNISYNESLIKQRHWGVKYHKERGHRYMHNHSYLRYKEGRHEIVNDTLIAVPINQLTIAWYGYSPFNEEIIKRKLQIQNKIPESDKRIGLGSEHFVTKDDLIGRLKAYQKNIINFIDDSSLCHYFK